MDGKYEFAEKPETLFAIAPQSSTVMWCTPALLCHTVPHAGARRTTLHSIGRPTMDMAAPNRRASFRGRTTLILAGFLILCLMLLALPRRSHAFGSSRAPLRVDPRAPAVPQAVPRPPLPGVGAVAGARQTIRPGGLDAIGPHPRTPSDYGAAALAPAARLAFPSPASSASCASSFSSSPVSSFPAPPTSSSTAWSWPPRVSAHWNLRAPLLVAAGAVYAAAPTTRARTRSHRGVDRRVGRRYVSCLRKRWLGLIHSFPQRDPYI